MPAPPSLRAAPFSAVLLLAALVVASAATAGGRSRGAPPARVLFGLGDVPPPWPATWQLNMSTAIMPANYNGWTRNVSQWGYVDFDCERRRRCCRCYIAARR
jgi:hypothetical protein